MRVSRNFCQFYLVLSLFYSLKRGPKVLGKVCYQLTGSSDFTFKSLLPVNWQQRIYVKIAAAS